MKYASKAPMQCMMTQSSCYKGTRKMQVFGILWHSTGANNPYLWRYVQPDDNAKDRDELIKKIGINNNRNDWNHAKVDAGLNAWVGKLEDGTVTTVQTMPWDYRPWGCGSGNKGSCNNGWIQFEICEDNLKNKDYAMAAYQEACELTAYLCKLYNIDPNGTVTMNGMRVPTILCHYDSYKLGLGSGHVDITHWFPKYGKDMASVRADVTALLKGGGVTVTPKPDTGGNTGGTAENLTYKAGDIVDFTGTKHYGGSNSTAGTSCTPGVAKVTYTAKGAKHPYHLQGSVAGFCGEWGSNVYGWVDAADISGLHQEAATTKPAPTPEKPEKLTAGMALKLTGVNLYAASGSAKAAGTVTGTYYVWSDGDVNGRIRITNSAANVGKAAQVTGWISRTDAEKAAGVTGTQTPTPSAPPAQTAYQVTVTASALNIRKGPGTNYATNGSINKGGAYTIVEEANGTGATKWGRLKSGAGWISLDYCKKI